MAVLITVRRREGRASVTQRTGQVRPATAGHTLAGKPRRRDTFARRGTPDSARGPVRALDLRPAGPSALLDELVQPRPGGGDGDDPPVQQRRQVLGDLPLARLAQLRLDAGEEGADVLGERVQPRIVRREVEGPVEGEVQLAEPPV